MKRPFAKLIVSEKNKANFDLCKKVTVSHRIPASFNVAEGTASTTETVAAELTDAAPIGAGDKDLTLFSCYAFAEKDDALKQITLSFKKGDDTKLRNTAIPAGVAFKRNHCTKAKGHLVAAVTDNTTVNVDVSDDWGDPEIDGGEVDPIDPTPEVEDPKVGSYYYKDGTWSAVRDTEKECVGIIFALAGDEGAAKGDVIANYPGTELTQIRGWVVAINEVKAKWAAAPLAQIIEGVECPTKTETEVCKPFIAGYKNSKAIAAVSNTETTYPAHAACMTWTPAVSGTSGWYMPSIGQLITLFDVCKNINPKITEANGKAILDVLLTSSLYKGKDANSPLGIQFKEGDDKYGMPRAQNIANQYYTRPILTF